MQNQTEASETAAPSLGLTREEAARQLQQVSSDLIAAMVGIGYGKVHIEILSGNLTAITSERRIKIPQKAG